jgi:SulP family sulfate permease
LLRPDPAPFPFFHPKLLTVWREGYGLRELRADAVAGLTVAVVALPLSMAIAIACGLPPGRGLTAAIVGGFLVSLLGGSRHQIGGPAGAFIVLVAASVIRHGVEGMLLATFLSGLMLAVLGLLRLGRFIKYIPYPVTLGFTAGIGAIILASQIVPFLGLRLPGPEPAAFLDKLPMLAAALPTVSPAAVAVGLGTIAVISLVRRHAPRLPGMLIAIALASVAAALGLPVETVGSRFGALPAGLPAPSLPDFALVSAVLPDALAFTLLGAIESLLSAVVADSLSGRRHRPDTELIAQGFANVASALFGGMPVTGTIARTATNVRAGAYGSVSGMIHALVLLAFTLVLAPLAAFIPLAALAGVLVAVAVHMLDVRTIVRLVRTVPAEAGVLIVTLAVTLTRDVVEAIALGTALGSGVIIHRLARMTEVIHVGLDEAPVHDAAGTVTLRITGAFFFGSAPVIEQALDRIGSRPRRLVLDLAAVPLIDTSGAQSLVQIAGRARNQGAEVVVEGATPAVARLLADAGLARVSAAAPAAVAVAAP